MARRRRRNPEPLVYSPSTNRYSGQKLTRGDVLRDDAGRLYSLDRANGFMLDVDELDSAGRRTSRSPSFSVDDSIRKGPWAFKALYAEGRNVFDRTLPNPSRCIDCGEKKTAAKERCRDCHGEFSRAVKAGKVPTCPKCGAMVFKRDKCRFCATPVRSNPGRRRPRVWIRESDDPTKAVVTIGGGDLRYLADAARNHGARQVADYFRSSSNARQSYEMALSDEILMAKAIEVLRPKIRSVMAPTRSL